MDLRKEFSKATKNENAEFYYFLSVHHLSKFSGAIGRKEGDHTDFSKDYDLDNVLKILSATFALVIDHPEVFQQFLDDNQKQFASYVKDMKDGKI